MCSRSWTNATNRLTGSARDISGPSDRSFSLVRSTATLDSLLSIASNSIAVVGTLLRLGRVISTAGAFFVRHPWGHKRHEHVPKSLDVHLCGRLCVGVREAPRQLSRDQIEDCGETTNLPEIDFDETFRLPDFDAIVNRAQIRHSIPERRDECCSSQHWQISLPSLHKMVVSGRGR